MSKSKKEKKKYPIMDTTEAIELPSWGMSTPTIGFSLPKSKGTGKTGTSVIPSLTTPIMPLMDTTEAIEIPSTGWGIPGFGIPGFGIPSLGFSGPGKKKVPIPSTGGPSSGGPSSGGPSTGGPSTGGPSTGGPLSGWGIPSLGFSGVGKKKVSIPSTGGPLTVGPLTAVPLTSGLLTGISLTSDTSSATSSESTKLNIGTIKYLFDYFYRSDRKRVKEDVKMDSWFLILCFIIIMLISIILFLTKKYSGLLDFFILAYMIISFYFWYKMDFQTFLKLSAIMLIIIIILISVFSNELTKFIIPLFIFASFILLYCLFITVLWFAILYFNGYAYATRSTVFNTNFSIIWTIEVISILILLFMYKKYSYFLLILSIYVSIGFVVMNNFSIYSFLIAFLIIMLILILAKCDLSLKTLYTETDKKITMDVFGILFFVILIILIIVFLSFNSADDLKKTVKEGDFASVGKLFKQIYNIFYVILYTILLIIFFTFMPSTILNTYSKVILPVTILIGMFAFYKSYTHADSHEEFNIKYDRIKTIVLLFCLITSYIIFYVTDPGGYIHKYFGAVSIISVIIAVFIFLYLIIIFTVSKDTEKGEKSENLLSVFSKTSTIGSFLFLLFIISMVLTIKYYPNGFFSDSNKTTIAAPAVIMILLICIFWSIMLIQNLFSNEKVTGTGIKIPTNLGLFQKSLMVLFAIVIGILTIVWLIYNLQNLSNSSSIFSFIINVIIMLILLNLIYKTVYVKIPDDKIGSKKNAFFLLIINTIFYIPCLFGDIFENIMNFRAENVSLGNETYGSLSILIISILLILGYFALPLVINKLNLQGGRLLVDNPVYTNTPYLLGTYEELNGSTNYDYQFAISFWFFLDSSQQTGGTAYASLLNFGNKPNVLYKTDTNTLLITIEDEEPKITKNATKTTNSINDYDANNKRILYKNSNVLLQKWNNIIINYSGGIMDIFLNNDLVKSNIGVVPYYTLDNLTIGQENGIKGGICNVVYYTQPLTVSNMYFLYNMVKDKNPPIINESNETILKQDWKIASSAVTSVSTPVLIKTSKEINNTSTNINNQIKT